MIRIRFPDAESKRAALGGLAGRFPFKSWASGEVLVPEDALPFLAVRGVVFTVEGPAQKARGGDPVISDPVEYEKAQEELRALEERLDRLRQAHPAGAKGFTKAGIRKMIARLHEELAVYEASEEARQHVPS